MDWVQYAPNVHDHKLVFQLLRHDFRGRRAIKIHWNPHWMAHTGPMSMYTTLDELMEAEWILDDRATRLELLDLYDEAA